MKTKMGVRERDSSVAVTLKARKELGAICSYRRQTKRLCLEDIIHEVFLTLPVEFQVFYMKNCD